MSDSCLQPDDALEFLAGSLDSEHRARVESHIDRCSDCAQLLAMLVRGPVQTQPSTDPQAPPDSLTGPGTEVRSLVAGERIGRYEITGERGRGGMGVVYAALDLELQRQVAIKLVRFGAGGDEGRRRLMREARSLARVSHRNVVAVFDVGIHEQQVFIAMEFVDGPTLGAWSKGRSSEEIVEAYSQAGAGLSAAHARGLVHRDFKPSNAIVGPRGRVVVLDFGLAYAGEAEAASVESVPSVSDEEAFETHSRAVLGTPAYMSPEQRWGRVTDARSDQYSFCVALYEALWSVHPLRAKGARLDRPLPPPRHADGRLWPAIARGLSLEPEDRFDSMDALLGEVSRVVAPRRRGWAVLGTGAVLAGVGTLALAGPSAPTCEDSVPSLAWGAPEADRIDAAFARTELPHAVEAVASVREGLDTYAQAWRAASLLACEARGRAEDPTVTDLRAACLDAGRAQFDATTELLAGADRDTVNAAATILARLPDPTRCETPQEQGDPLEAEFRARLLAASNRFDGGQIEAGLAEAKQVESDAAISGSDAVHALALIDVARMLIKVGDVEAAKERLSSAAWMADAAGANRASAEAWTELVWLYAYHELDLDRAREATRHAAAAIDRLGGHDELQAVLDRNAGWIEMKAGDPAAAETRFRAAAAQIKPETRDGHMIAIDLGGAMQAQGKYDEARKVLEATVVDMERELGREHPDLAAALNNLGSCYRGLGRADDALPLYERLVELQRINFGRESIDTARARINFGIVLSDHERYEDALAQYDLAYEVFAQHFDEGHPMMGWIHDGRGTALYGLQKLDESRAELERAIAIKVEALGPNHPRLAESYANLGIVAFDAGDMERALVQLTKADDIMRTGLSESYPQRGFVRNAMGAALKALGRPQEARQMYAWVAELPTVAGTPIEAEARQALEAL